MTDRIAVSVLRLFAKLMLIIGVSLLVAGAPTLGMPSVSPAVRAITGYFLEFGAAFGAAGGLALYLSRPRGFLLPNESEAMDEEEHSELGGALILLAISLIALPVLTVIGLQPLRSEWDRVIDLLVMSGIFEGLHDPLSGIVLVPVAAALTPAAVEYAAMAAFTGASAMLLVLLLSRSTCFPRLYLVCMALFAGFVIASVRAVAGLMLAVEAFQELMQGTNARPEEIAQVREVIGQHVEIVSSAAEILLWIVCGYLVWLPVLFTSRRVCTTFASRVSTAQALQEPPISRP